LENFDLKLASLMQQSLSAHVADRPSIYNNNKIMAKATDLDGVILTHEAQAIKLRNNLQVFWLPLFMFTCSRRVSVIIKWATKSETAFNSAL